MCIRDSITKGLGAAAELCDLEALRAAGASAFSNDGLCIRHAQKTRHTARGSGTAAGENILLGGKTGIAQVDVHVHQSGGGAQAALTVDDLRVAHLRCV